MSNNQEGNRIPTIPKPTPEFKQSGNIENPITYGDPSSSGKGELGGAPDWVSHPNPENSYNIEAGEHFKQQGNLPKVKKQ